MEAIIDGRALHIGRPSNADRSDPRVGAAVAGAESEGCTAVVLREDTHPLPYWQWPTSCAQTPTAPSRSCANWASSAC